MTYLTCLCPVKFLHLSNCVMAVSTGCWNPSVHYAVAGFSSTYKGGFSIMSFTLKSLLRSECSHIKLFSVWSRYNFILSICSIFLSYTMTTGMNLPLHHWYWAQSSGRRWVFFYHICCRCTVLSLPDADSTVWTADKIVFMCMINQDIAKYYCFLLLTTLKIGFETIMLVCLYVLVTFATLILSLSVQVTSREPLNSNIPDAMAQHTCPNSNALISLSEVAWSLELAGSEAIFCRVHDGNRCSCSKRHGTRSMEWCLATSCSQDALVSKRCILISIRANQKFIMFSSLQYTCAWVSKCHIGQRFHLGLSFFSPSLLLNKLYVTLLNFDRLAADHCNFM
jgi:hypothetical protein